MKKRIMSMYLVFTMLMYGLRLCGASEMTGATTIQAKENTKQTSSRVISNKKDIVPLKHNDELIKTNKKGKYLVYTSSDEEMKRLKTLYPDSQTSNSNATETLEGKNILTVSMTGKEAEQVQNGNKVLRVEKDAMIHGCGHINGRKLIKKKQNAKEAEWNMQSIKANKIKKNKKSEASIKVAVIDSGVDVGNDINVVNAINMIPGEEELLPLFTDVSGHGTSVAGIIGARDNKVGITGVNPNVQIYSARVLDNDNQAPVSRVVDGIYWAIENHVNIINMSFGMQEDSVVLHQAIVDAYNEGILLVAAAGNTGAEVEYPAAYPEVIAVGSVNSDGSVSEDSATSEEVELVAPGECVKSTAGFETTLICSGTSMAAPHVVGIASLLWEKDLSMSSVFIRKLLDASANHYNSNVKYGYGLVDAEYAACKYEELKKPLNDTSLNIADRIATNESPVVVYEENDYVEGSWTKHIHDEMVSDKGLSGDNLRAIKLGAVYPDLTEKLSKISQHGAFHGRGAWLAGLMTDAGNYVANTIYLSKIANSGSIDTYQAVNMYVNELSSDELFDLNQIYKRLKDCEKDPNPENEPEFLFKNKYFLLGIAIHCATDAYAHSAFAYKRNRWYRIVHPAETSIATGNVSGRNIVGADDISFSIGRWYCANHVAANMISNFGNIDYKVFMVEDYIQGEQAVNSDIYPFLSLPFSLFRLYTFADTMESRSIDERGVLFGKTMWSWK